MKNRYFSFEKSEVMSEISYRIRVTILLAPHQSGLELRELVGPQLIPGQY
jgi:hypothetical protein